MILYPMKKLLLSAAIFAFLQCANCVSALECDAKTEAKAATVAAAPAVDDGYAIGEVKVAIPCPDAASYIEMPAPMKTATEASLPPTNRLLCGFVNKNDMTGISSASVQSIRPLETAMLANTDFNQIVAQTKAMMGGATVQDAIKELDKNHMIAGQPKMLGTLFEREDMYASSLLIAVNTPTGTVSIAVGTVMMRVKQKLVVASISAPYKDEKTIEALKGDLDAWATVIASANK